MTIYYYQIHLFTFNLIFLNKFPQLSTVAADPFTSRLFDIYEKVWEQGTAQVSIIKLPTISVPGGNDLPPIILRLTGFVLFLHYDRLEANYDFSSSLKFENRLIQPEKMEWNL